MLANSDNKNVYIHKFWPRMIYDNYVIILVLYDLFVDYGIFGNYCQH